MTAFRLFDRRYVLQVGDTKITELDIAFSIRRSLKKEPNKGVISVWNLSPDTRQKLTETRSVFVRLEAGYASGTNVIFQGRSVRVFTQIEGPDVVTRIEATDGRQLKNKRINLSFGKGATLDNILSRALRDLGLGEGNYQRVRSLLGSKLNQAFAGGTVLSGNALTEIEGVLERVDASLSIQSEVVQILSEGVDALGAEAVILGPEFGAIGSPEITEKGVLLAKTLIIPDLFPGRKVVMSPGTVVQGIFLVTTAQYTGEINEGSGTPWYIDIEARPSR